MLQAATVKSITSNKFGERMSILKHFNKYLSNLSFYGRISTRSGHTLFILFALLLFALFIKALLRYATTIADFYKPNGTPCFSKYDTNERDPSLFGIFPSYKLAVKQPPSLPLPV